VVGSGNVGGNKSSTTTLIDRKENSLVGESLES
jgi:hypothetical protein